MPRPETGLEETGQCRGHKREMELRVIADRYRLVERLGKGAMGVVYSAHDPVLDRTVAVKMMAADLGDDARLRARFLKEARAAARLNHRHVVTIHELVEDDGDICIIMELLDGVDLTALISRPSQLQLASKLTIIDQVLDGLHYAHEQGVVHRDIKPGNLHLTSAGVAKILDFGIARLVTAQTTGTRGLVGTPAYMSPEQALGHAVDRRTDLFALGSVVYELLSGARPFQADSIDRLMTLITEVAHPPLGPEVPERVARFVDRLLSKDPDDRPETAAAAREALADVMPSGTSSAGDQDPTLDISEIVRQTVTARRTVVPDSAPTIEARPAAGAGRRRASSSGLTSFALQQGRTLREQGDLGGAMRALRSVLEADPGNAEALSELQLVEQELSGSGAQTGVGGGSAAPAGWRSPTAVACVVVAVGLMGWWFAGLGLETDGEPAPQAALASRSSGPSAAPTGEPPGPVPSTPDGRPDEPGARIEPGPPPAEQPPPEALAPSARQGPPPAAVQPDPVPRPPPPGGPPFGRGRGGVRGGRAGARDRFEQLRRAADRQELDRAVSTQLATIRRDAEAAVAAGNVTEAGEIYLRGIQLLEEALPPGRRPPRRDPPPVTGGAGENAIRRVIDEYAGALERRDAAAVRGIRPRLSAYEQRLLGAAAPPVVRFEEFEIEAGAGTATVIARWVVERTDVQPRRQESRVQVSLRRNGARWRITDVRALAPEP